MRYIIVEAQSAEELQRKVQEHIRDGWEPQGGVAVATYGAMAWSYHQALVMRAGQ